MSRFQRSRHPAWHGPRQRGRRLQHQLFLSFGLAILAAMLISVAVFTLVHAQGGHHPWFRPLALFAAGNLLWMLSGWAARRIARPLHELSHVAGELGRGKLESRVSLPRGGPKEIGELAATFNEMAARIETQVTSQKELLGAVSHELRTPLAHMRVLLALVQEHGTNPELVAKLEREILEMDALVGELLAGARVEAGALVKRTLDLGDLVRECVERSGLAHAAIEIASDTRSAIADATLLSRALAVLLDNAEKHGGKALVVRVSRDGTLLRFMVEDDGPGFGARDLPQLFAPFARDRGQAPDENRGVGLGLYLVRRIAEAHGGTAFAENRRLGDACVGFTLADAANPKQS